MDAGKKGRGVRVLVCGGRDYNDRNRVFVNLYALHETVPISCIIEGGARGADHLASRWSYENDIPTVRFFADWIAHGRRAGPIRNQQMLDEGRPDLVVAFPGGRGTADMVRRATKAGVEVIQIAAAA